MISNKTIETAPYWSGSQSDLPPIGAVVEYKIGSSDEPQYSKVIGYQLYQLWPEGTGHRIIIKMEDNARHFGDIQQCPRDKKVSDVISSLVANRSFEFKASKNEIEYIACVAVDTILKGDSYV